MQRQWNEDEVVLPPYPAKAQLLEFSVTPSNGFRFYIDTRSLSVGKDGVVRYVLVARSDSGAENVTFEGLRCAQAEYRIYAVGRSPASASAAGDSKPEWAGRAAGWRPIAGERLQLWRTALHREYFCAQNQPIRDAADGIRALERGGHPFARGDFPRGR
jgi:hypothetical protein